MIDTARPVICTAALWSNCRCPKCQPNPGAPGRAPDAAARHSLIGPTGGGTSFEPGGDLAVVEPPHPAADRAFPLSDHPIGGVSLEERHA